MKPVIEIEQVSITFPRRRLLDNINLSFCCGKLTALLGPNGCGKTSLLRAIAGEQECGGAVHLFKRPLADWDRSTEIRRRLAQRFGVLPQHSSLTFAFTCEEVVRLGFGPGSLSRAEQRERVQHCLRRADVWHLRERLFPSLSGGEKQRVQLARVLAQLTLADPGTEKILLLDEPTSALDLRHQHQVLQLAREVAADNTAVVVVLHDLNLAARYADRVVMLSEGAVRGDGPPAELIQPELVEQIYGYRGRILPCGDYHALL